MSELGDDYQSDDASGFGAMDDDGGHDSPLEIVTASATTSQQTPYVFLST
jgi:hypothetical protein